MAVTVEDLGELLKSEPPRIVPRKIRRKKGLLVLILFGTVFSLFSVPFMVVFFPWRLVDELTLDLGDPAVALGEVVGVEETNMSVNDTSVHAIEFTFQTPDGQTVTGVCYETGGRQQPGQSVEIEYIRGTERISRVKGCRISPFGYFTSFIILFPLVGGAMVFFCLRARWRFVRLLRHGVFERGDVIAVDETSVVVNGQRRYKVSVSYDAPGGQTVATYNAYGREVTVAQERMKSGEQVGLLYDGSHRDRVIIVDSLLG